MIVWAVDPGPKISALVVYNGAAVVEHGQYENKTLLERLSHRTRRADETLVVEQIAGMGMAVGDEVHETTFWSGRFVQAWAGYHAEMPWDRVKRHTVKMHLCGTMKAKDGNIRQALIDRFGGSAAIGRKKTPGPLYGLAGDQWQALAVGVTWYDNFVAKGAMQ